MDRPDHIIERVQDLRVVIESAVCHDVRFDPLQNAKSLHLGVEAVDLVVLQKNLVALESAGIKGRLRVIRDSEVVPTALSGSVRHLLDRRRTVRVNRVAMENAAKVVEGHQLRELATRRCFDLSHSLSQLRRNRLEIERREEAPLILQLYPRPVILN